MALQAARHGSTGAVRQARWQRARRRPGHGHPAAGDGRIGRRRKVDADRPAALRLQGDLRGPACLGGADQQGARRGVHQPRAADRRPACRARAGHHHRRRLPLLRDAAAQVHHRRHAWAHSVHAQHGDRRVHRRPRDRAGRRQERADRAESQARVPHHAAARAAPGARGQQDGPGQLRAGGVQQDRRGIHRLRHQAGDRRPYLYPDLGAAWRQRRRALAEYALVQRPVAAAPPRARAHRIGPQPDRRQVPRAVCDQAAPGHRP